MHGYPYIQAAYPQARRATSQPAYLALLRMEVTAFHVRLSAYSSLWPYSSPHGGRPLTGILLYGARTFLPLKTQGGDCLISFIAILTRISHIDTRKPGNNH
uniref:Uncharacterized protein n=1 Tax=mine drainage metagenome TaxID=410659 RepID=E6QVD5_9ZZZZ